MPLPAPHASHARRSALQHGLAATALIAAPALWLGPRAQQPAHKRLTPSQTEGPYYPVRLPDDHDADLLRSGARRYQQGQPTWLEGEVTNPSGEPVRGAAVEIWQCDHNGRYHHPGDGNQADPNFQGFGRVSVDAQGRYRFRTLRPVTYGGRAPHIHLKVKLGSRELLTTQVYVQGEPRNERDMLWRSIRDEADRLALTVPFQPVSDGLLARFPIVVAA